VACRGLPTGGKDGASHRFAGGTSASRRAAAGTADRSRGAPAVREPATSEPATSEPDSGAIIAARARRPQATIHSEGGQ